jgi:hypothetical protein
MNIGTITINDISGGWINDFAKGSASSLQKKPNSYYSGLLNINKPNYLGQISNAFGENPSSISYSQTQGYVLNGTVASNSYGYFIDQKGEILETNLTNSFPSSIVGYTEPASCTFDNYKDIWKHVEPTTGIEAVFFTYQTGANAYVGYARVGAIATRNNTYKVLTNLNVPHVGCVSVNNQSYVTDKNILWAYDPITGTWSSINCGLGITLTSVADYGNYVGAVGSNGTTSWLFLWNGTSGTVPTYKYEIRDTNVTALINEGGSLRVFTYGKNNTTKIKTFYGNAFSEEADWETPTSLCSSPVHGAVDVWLNQIVWKASQTVSGTTTDGYIWTYGSPRKNEIGTGAHRVGKVTTNAITTGCVKNLYQDALFIGLNNSTLSYIYQVKAASSYASTMSSNLKTALYDLPANSTIERIQFFFSDYTVPGTATSGSSLTCSLYRDYDTATDLLAYSIPINDTTTSSTIYYFPVTQTVDTLYSIYLNIVFANCTIRKIILTYTYYDNDL